VAGEKNGVKEMSSDVIARMLDELGGRATIRPDGGAFHARVMEDVAGQLDDIYEDLDEAAFDVEIQLESDPDPRKVSLAIRAVSADFDTTIRIHASQLNSRERSAVLKELLAEKRKHEARREASARKVIVRKKSDNSYDLHIAAQKLDVPTDWLKKTVPCTGYQCDAGADAEAIHRFRYQKDVIDRLCKVRDNTFDEADLNCLADLCCEGDSEWARDIIDSFKSRRSGLRE